MKPVIVKNEEPGLNTIVKAIDEIGATRTCVDGFEIEGAVAKRGDERFELDLMTDEFAYYIAPDADETRGVAMFRLGAHTPLCLASDNWLASDSYAKDVDRIAAGDLHPIFTGPASQAAVEAAKEENDGNSRACEELIVDIEDVLAAACDQAEIWSVSPTYPPRSGDGRGL